MAFDPHREDYQRLGLRFARSLDARDPLEAARAFAGFGRTFARDRDSLPQTDADRAFHLVALATSLIDYEMPFVSESEAASLGTKAKAYLGEALDLDPLCFDAQRMLAAAEAPSFEAYYDYLRSEEDKVRAACEDACSRLDEAEGSERTSLARDLGMRPYARWIACAASKALICGHNHAALSLCSKLLDLDPLDRADARFTAALAYAKLEDEKGLDGLQKRLSPRRQAFLAEDAWTQLARVSLAYKAGQAERARAMIAHLLNSYPHAAETLMAQKELPDGVYARLAVSPFSEDELILAVSEATILLQEGRDSQGRGALGSWLAATVADLSRRQTSLAELAGSLLGSISSPHEPADGDASSAQGGATS